MAKRELQPINAGSMADIAFLLLIFFLVTTTMDSDIGLLRLLPPMPDPNAPVPEASQINDRNILEVKVNMEDLLLVEGERANLDELREITKYFILNPANDPTMSEKELKSLPFFGEVMATKAVISLQNDRGTTYAVYIAVQNELLAARDELKNDLARNQWGKSYDQLDEEQQKAVDDYYYVPISEAEPKKIGGNK
ncbi:MAG: biopolymer transporter ExbD [Bacteroidales bacterium]|jgi:biopolymer transport protein ExbD|nr:biopolymer transporter ExbD [Bacteroidales bacterium]